MTEVQIKSLKRGLRLTETQTSVMIPETLLICDSHPVLIGPQETSPNITGYKEGPTEVNKSFCYGTRMSRSSNLMRCPPRRSQLMCASGFLKEGPCETVTLALVKTMWPAFSTWDFAFSTWDCASLEFGMPSCVLSLSHRSRELITVVDEKCWRGGGKA